VIAKGLIWGVLIGALNFLVLFLTTRYFVSRVKKLATLTFVVFYLLRYAMLGGLVYLFLERGWGSPLGLLGGITIGLVAFLMLRKMYYDGSTGSH
jgi:hypothetical protein